MVTERLAFGSTSNAPDRIAFGSSWYALELGEERERERERERKHLSRFVFSKHQCLHHHQCSNCHKISVQDLTLFYSTTLAAASAAPPPHGEEERDRFKRRSLLRLPVCVHPQFHFTHQQYNCTSSSQSAPDRNRGGTQRSRQLPVSLLLFLSVYCTSSQSKCVFFSPKNLDLSDLFAPKSKDWTQICARCHASSSIVASVWSRYMVWIMILITP